MKAREQDAEQEDSAIEALEVACTEGRETLNQQVSWLRQIDQKSIRILRANILLLGLTLTALSILVRADAVNFEPYVNLYTGSGVLSMLLSTIFAGITYISSRFEGGVGPVAVQDTFEKEYSSNQLYDRLAQGYANWINYNDLVIRVNAHLCTTTILLAINAVIFVTVGVLAGATGYDGTRVSYILFTAVLAAISTLNILAFKIDDIIENLYSWRNGNH